MQNLEMFAVFANTHTGYTLTQLHESNAISLYSHGKQVQNEHAH